MVDQLLGLLLLGLGIKNPMTGQVAGEQTVQQLQRTPEPSTDNTSVDTSRGGRSSGREGRPVGRPLEQEARDQKEHTIKEIQAKNEAKKTEFQKKLHEFKDTHKQEIVQKLQTKLGEVNAKRTQKMTEQLVKLQEILDKLTTRASDLKAKGLNTSSAEAKLAVAKTALDAAKSAVAAQGAKTYTIAVNSESTAKNDVGAAMSGLQKDLQGVYQTVFAAKKALRDAALALRVLSDEPVETQ